MRYEPGVHNATREGWLLSVGFEPHSVLALPLVHSRKVYRARIPADLAGLEGDGIITDNPEACAVLTVADCMPIFLFDPDSGAFGILHSGWKGTGILAVACRLMAAEFGTRASRLCVSFGPRVGVCCYPVDEARAGIFADEFGSSAVVVRDGQPRLDLLAANLALADSLGISSITISDACTSCDMELGSYRREGPAAFTRMAAAIGDPRGLEGG
ncbi:MAG: polyphenol oxidase family protein, partial [Spirochaetia bacterium]|nr:polyphenol oxidase family protein [Spirochaetia bacterium]